MQIKLIIFLSMTFINFNIFALPDGKGPSDSEFQNFKNKKQDILVQEIIGMRKLLQVSDPIGLITNGATHTLIKILLKNQNSIDYKYWSVSYPANRVDLAIEQTLAILELNDEGNIFKARTEQSLREIAHIILKETRKKFMAPMLENYIGASEMAYFYWSYDWFIKIDHMRILIEVLLRDTASIDYDFWSKKFPIEKIDLSPMLYDAVDEMMKRAALTPHPLDPKYKEHMADIAEHVLIRAHYINIKEKLARFANEPGAKRRALLQKSGAKVVDFKSAADKAKK